MASKTGIVNYSLLGLCLRIYSLPLALTLVLATTDCSSTPRSRKVRQLQFVYNFPVRAFKENDVVKLLIFRDTTSIYYLDDYILYRFPPVVEFETNENVPGTEPYLLLKKGALVGHYFNTIKDSIGVLVPVDSTLRKKGLRGEDFESPSDTAWKLITGMPSDERGQIVEKFAYTREPGKTTFDSICYYYSKNMNDVDFSFSHTLDSIKQAKLFRIRFIQNPRFSEEDQFEVPKSEYSFDLKDVTPKQTEDIETLFKHFRELAGI